MRCGQPEGRAAWRLGAASRREGEGVPASARRIAGRGSRDDPMVATLEGAWLGSVVGSRTAKAAAEELGLARRAEAGGKEKFE
eukprot:3486665-Heterocapsa_arctica.AAC.1